MSEFDFKGLYDHLGEEGAIDGTILGIDLHTAEGKLKDFAKIIYEALRLASESRPVTQHWVNRLSLMQQSVLISAIRGCDGMPKRHKHKPLVKWYRRCVLISAFDGMALTDPFAPGGGSFTGPVVDLPALNPDGHAVEISGEVMTVHDWRCSMLQKAADDFMDSRDELPAHYTTHFMHAVEIIGYKHPDLQIREFWFDLYERLVHALHTWPETEAQMDSRLGDNEGLWRARGDVSSSCSD